MKKIKYKILSILFLFVSILIYFYLDNERTKKLNLEKKLAAKKKETKGLFSVSKSGQNLNNNFCDLNPDLCTCPPPLPEVSEHIIEYIYPLNPKTGKSFSESELNEFEDLRKYFPDNDLIPKKLPKNEHERKLENEKEFLKAEKSILSKKYSISEVNIYYDYKLKKLNDKIQILEYNIDLAKENDEEEKIKEFKKILDDSKKEILEFEKEKLEKKNKFKQIK